MESERAGWSPGTTTPPVVPSADAAAGEDDLLSQQGLYPDRVLEQLAAGVGHGLVEEDRCHQRDADRAGPGADGLTIDGADPGRARDAVGARVAGAFDVCDGDQPAEQ